MTDPVFLILGGYGNTGRDVAQLLLQETNTRLVLAGRNQQKADQAAAEFNQIFPGARVTGRAVDASDYDGLQRALDGIDMVVVASSTSEHIETTARAAIHSQVDWMDPQYSTDKIKSLRSLSQEITQAGCCFITDAGFHPGLPAALVRFAAPKFDQLQAALVSSVIKINWADLDLGGTTMNEFVSEFMSFKPVTFQDKRWVNLGFWSMMKPVWFEFGEPFGRQYGIAMDLDEMHSLPDLYPELVDTGFYVGGFNWFVDWIVSPLAVIAMKISPRKGLPLAAKLMGWGLNKFSKPPYGTLLKLDSRGIANGRQTSIEIFVSHPDGYMLTAIPMVACLLQYIDGEIRVPGLWYQALVVEPERFMKDIERLGAVVKVHQTNVI